MPSFCFCFELLVNTSASTRTFFFFNDTSPTEIYTLSLHDALPIFCFLTVGVLVWVGAGMRGNLFNSRGNDAFDSLGYLADLGTGGFYWVAKGLETNGPDVSRADGDYGTRFLATAGVFNLLAALHAYEVARGRKV